MRYSISAYLFIIIIIIIIIIIEFQRFFSKMSVNILDIGASTKLELVDKLCYMLSVDGDVDAAVETGIRIGWNNFRQLVPLLTSKEVSLTMRGRL